MPFGVVPSLQLIHGCAAVGGLSPWPTVWAGEAEPTTLTEQFQHERRLCSLTVEYQVRLRSVVVHKVRIMCLRCDDDAVVAIWSLRTISVRSSHLGLMLPN